MTTRCRDIRFLALAVALGALIPLAPATAEARDVESEEVLLTDGVGFRTDLGLHLSVGGNSCLGGGTGYAECSGTEHAWDTSWGLAGGFIVRPWWFLSIGIDLAYTNMIYHQATDNTWSDLAVGPTVRLHLPFNVRGFVLEPNLGLHLGYVQGVYHENETQDGRTMDYDHDHMGFFLSILLGADFFVLPKFALGVEFRLLRTFYDEVCFEWSDGTNCRGVDDEAIEKRYDDNLNFPGEKGIVDYPWKLFWGVHGLYYF